MVTTATASATVHAPDALMLVGGRWVAARSGATFPSVDPATGAIVGEAPAGEGADATLAVDAAHEAFASWSRTTVHERAALLRRVAAILGGREGMLAELITAEQGKPLGEARNELRFCCHLLEWYAEEGRRAYGQWIPDPLADRRLLTMRRPVGVAAAITPWNVPASMVVRKAAPAIAAGCTVVVKPAEQTPLVALAVARAFDDAGTPPGVLNVVTGGPEPIGAALLADVRVRKLTFTGSTEVGRALLRASADTVKRVSLELGGNAPFVVFDDADLDAAVAGLRAAKFRNGGQTCVSANRVFVHHDVAAQLGARLRALAWELRVGDGRAPETEIGPLVDRRAVEKVAAAVEDAVARGARVLTGGSALTEPPYDAGSFFAPTVLAGVHSEMRLVQEEIFGPVAPLIAFDDAREVLEAANATPYGLTAYVYTRDLRRALRMAEELDVGMVGINDTRVSAAEAPFGGTKQSGLGREGGREGLDEFLETRLVALGLGEPL